MVGPGERRALARKEAADREREKAKRKLEAAEELWNQDELPMLLQQQFRFSRVKKTDKEIYESLPGFNPGAAAQQWDEIGELLPRRYTEYLDGTTENLPKPCQGNPDFEDDPPIYIRIWVPPFYEQRIGYYKWHVIQPGNITLQDAFLDCNILPDEPDNKDLKISFPILSSNSSRIHVLGFVKDYMVEAYSIDITGRIDAEELDWEEEGSPLIRPIPQLPFLVSLSNKYVDSNQGNPLIFVLGWDITSDKSYRNRSLKGVPSDLLLTNRGGRCPFNGHLIVEDNTKAPRLLVYNSVVSCLYECTRFSPSSPGEWAPVCQDFVKIGSSNSSAIVDGVLYTMTNDPPGHIFALDASSSSSSQKKTIPVKLKHPKDGLWWVPQATGNSFFMVPLGNSKLAILWYINLQKLEEHEKDDFRTKYFMVIWCTRWKVSKADKARGKYVLKAYSRARYLSDASNIVDCLPTPIIQPQRQETHNDVANPSKKQKIDKIQPQRQETHNDVANPSKKQKIDN